MRWCFDSGNHAYADNVLEMLVADAGEAHVPVHEVSAVLARAQRTGLLTAERVEDFLDSLGVLNIVVDTQGVDRILTDVHRLAVTYRLALRRNSPLATLDAELRIACGAAGVSVL